MAEQQHSARRRDHDAPEPEAPAPAAPQTEGLQARRDEALDSILDEIDGVLETNAQEFVHGFIQKGGQ